MLDITEQPPFELEATSRTCHHCDKPFEPRKGSGGQPQRFCSTTCRTAYHAAEGQRGQRSPTCSDEKTLAASQQPGEEPAPLTARGAAAAKIVTEGRARGDAPEVIAKEIARQILLEEESEEEQVIHEGHLEALVLRLQPIRRELER